MERDAVVPGQLRLMNDSDLVAGGARGRTFLTLGIDPDFSGDPRFWLCLMSDGAIRMFSETALHLYSDVLE